MDPETLRLLDTLEKELAQRLEKLWRIFTWCSGILISITTGLLVTMRAVQKFALYPKDRIILSFIILILGTYAFLWLKENLSIETNIRNKIESIYQIHFSEPYLKKRPDNVKYGYLHVILILSLLALLTIWLDQLIG